MNKSKSMWLSALFIFFANISSFCFVFSIIVQELAEDQITRLGIIVWTIVNISLICLAVYFIYSSKNIKTSLIDRIIFTIVSFSFLFPAIGITYYSFPFFVLFN